MKIPRVSSKEMRRIDDLAINHFGVESVQMMENAGKAVASMARKMVGVRGKTITILCGKGNNGGDGLVAARFLQSWGATVNIILLDHPDELKPLVKYHYGTSIAMHQNRMTTVDSLKWEIAMMQSHLIIDAILGYSQGEIPEECMQKQ